jgi:hypothetical protein
VSSPAFTECSRTETSRKKYSAEVQTRALQGTHWSTPRLPGLRRITQHTADVRRTSTRTARLPPTPTPTPTCVRTHYRSQGWFVFLLHRKDICADPKDGVEEEDTGRVLLEVRCAVLVTKLEVIQERACNAAAAVQRHASNVMRQGRSGQALAGVHSDHVASYVMPLRMEEVKKQATTHCQQSLSIGGRESIGVTWWLIPSACSVLKLHRFCINSKIRWSCFGGRCSFANADWILTATPSSQNRSTPSRWLTTVRGRKPLTPVGRVWKMVSSRLKSGRVRTSTSPAWSLGRARTCDHPPQPPASTSQV